MSGRFEDGFSTTISFSQDTNVLFYEKEVTPPGFEGGGAIATTNMRNTAWRTKAPKSLKDLTDISLTVQYEAGAYDEILAMLLVNQAITITFPDGSTVLFYGWIDTFVPSPMVEGEEPTAEVTIIPSNRNTSGVETGPAYTVTT